MSDFSIASLWCVLQVAILVCIVIAATYWFERRDSRVGSAFCNGMLLVLLFASCLVVVPLADETLAPLKTTSSGHGAISLDPPLPTTERQETMHRDELINLRWLRTHVASSSNAIAKSNQKIGWGIYVFAAVAGLAALIGVLRVSLAAQSIRLVLKTATLEKADTVHHELKRLSTRMGFEHSVRVLKTPKLRSAAAIDWGKPTILLPSTWGDWSSEELRAVLAHELAHLSRRDCMWRAIAALLMTIHGYNPFVFLFSRRLILMQELAADQLAGETLGNPSTYLRALTQLALREDKKSLVATEGLLPVFSGELIRRIKMLNQHDSTTRTEFSKRCVVIGATLLLVSCGGFVGLRGFAQSPQAEPAARVALRSITGKSKPADGSLMRSLETNNRHGMLIIRLDELMQQPELATMIKSMLGEMIPQSSEDSGGGLRGLGGIENIEYVAARPVLSVRYQHPQATDASVAFGGSLFVVKLKEPRKLSEWVNEFQTGAERKTHDGANYFQLPVMHQFGPVPMCVAQRPGDTSSLIFGTCQARTVDSEIRFDEPPTDLCEFIVGKPGDEDAARWVKDWNEVQGGTVSMICSDTEIHDFARSNQEKLDVFKHVRTFGVRFQFPLKSDRFRAKIFLGCDDQASALKAKAALETRYATMKQYIEDEVDQGKTRLLQRTLRLPPWPMQ